MKTKRKAFTLIELLVVISIIALLLSILLPSLRQVKRQARTVICQTNLKQWGYMFQLYASDNEDRFCPSWSPVAWDKDWHDYLRAYSEEAYDIMLCPEGARIATCSWNGFAQLSEGATWPHAAWVDAPNYQPGDRPIKDYDYGSYTYNSWATSIPDDTGYLDYAQKLLAANCWQQTSKVTTPSNVPLITDGKWPSAWVNDTNYPPANPLLNIPWADENNNVERICSDRHYGNLVSVFADGSTRKIGIKELWKLKWHKSFNTKNHWATDQGQRPWPDWMRGFKDY